MVILEGRIWFIAGCIGVSEGLVVDLGFQGLGRVFGVSLNTKP